jgi:hypothetical protein
MGWCTVWFGARSCSSPRCSLLLVGRPSVCMAPGCQWCFNTTSNMKITWCHHLINSLQWTHVEWEVLDQYPNVVRLGPWAWPPLHHNLKRNIASPILRYLGALPGRGASKIRSAWRSLGTRSGARWWRRNYMRLASVGTRSAEWCRKGDFHHKGDLSVYTEFSREKLSSSLIPLEKTCHVVDIALCAQIHRSVCQVQ